MTEGQLIRELTPRPSLADQVREVFERKAAAGDRNLILKTYQQKFDALVATLPKEQQDTMMVKIQKEIVNISGLFYEYGARFTDYVRSVFLWPMVAATKDFPKDKNYQLQLARAQAWGEVAQNTVKTMTAERNTYRDHFMPTAVVGAQAVGAVGTYIGATMIGVEKGTLLGAATGGIYGVAIGAAAGGILGGAASLAMRYKDMIMGPPVLYFNQNGLLRQAAANAVS